MINDHYFETRFTDADGKALPPQRYRTLQGAMADIIGLPEGSTGSIWYQDEPESEAVEVLRQEADGTMIDVQNDDGTNYPLGGVPEDIEPGPMEFSLWLQDPAGQRAAYDFGFYWDGENGGQWQCSPGSGGPGYEGTIRWSQEHVTWIDYGEEPESDDLGDDLVVTYTSAGDSNQGGEVVLKDAAITEPFDRDSWVEVAHELFGFLRGKGLI